jgi:hypothetical protein
MGQTMPVTGPGQRPPAASPTLPRSHLIGPLLESAPDVIYFVALAASPIDDLADFANTSWRDRLLLVRLSSSYQPEWPHTATYAPGDDPNLVVDMLLALNKNRKDNQ